MTCLHINQKEIEHHEKSVQQKDGRFQTIRMHQWECLDCGAVLSSKVERDAVASNRSIDDYWGVTYE